MASIEEQQSGPTLSPEQMMASSGQNDVDYQLALQLSMQSDNNNNNAIADTTAMSDYCSNATHSNISNGTIVALPTLPNNARIEVGVPMSKLHPSESDQEAMDRRLALQLQQERISIPNNETDEAASLRLARLLQEEENAHVVEVRSENNRIGTATDMVENTGNGMQRPPTTSAKANSNCTIM